MTAGKVRELEKSLQGLKQSPTEWFGRFRRVTIKFMSKHSNADHNMHIKRIAGKFMALIANVDDCLFCF